MESMALTLSMGEDILPDTDARYSEKLRILKRFLYVSMRFDELDMSLQDITDIYSEIAAELYYD